MPNFRGERFAGHPRDLLGDNDVLNLTRPDAVERVHRGHLAAGAHIVSTNTFTATAVAQADYGLADAVYDMNRAGAEIARRAADAAGPDRFVAGSVGPTNQTLSMSPRVADAAYRAITFDELIAAYAEQIRGLRDGGVDLLLIETIFDTLNAKAAIAAALDVFEPVYKESKGADGFVSVEVDPSLAHDGAGTLAAALPWVIQPVVADVLVFVLAIVFIKFRPQGLVSGKGI